jgi:NTP pyrophosphatase (non-canonical NTP hydrolase)
MKEVTDYLSPPELLAQLAEEAAELSQAALKLRRAMTGYNPTPVTVDDAVANLIEEVADVNSVLSFLLSDGDIAEMEEIKQRKHKRWLNRLEEHRHNEN